MAFVQANVPIASKGHVQIQLQDPDATNVDPLYTFEDVGCLVGDVSLQRTWANQSSANPIENWCTIGDEGSVAIAQFSAGEKTVTSTITIEADITTDAYQFLRRNKASIFNLQFILSNAANTGTKTLKFRVRKTSDTLSMRGGRGQTTQLSFDIQAVADLT